VFTDPPYNVPISGHVGGLGSVQHREFAMASGEMSPAEFTAFLTSVFRHLAEFSVDGSIHFQCMDWRHAEEILQAGKGAYSELKNICVWAKNNGGMGSLYRSQHEFVFVFKSGAVSHINNVELGKHGRYRTNIWSYPGVNSFGTDRSDLVLHPTVKPVAMVADAIRDCSHRKGIVLDAFTGSGTTLIAAERTGRRGFGIENRSALLRRDNSSAACCVRPGRRSGSRREVI
jgi:DNA modification methylase